MNYNLPELRQPNTYKVPDNYTINNETIPKNYKLDKPYYVSPLDVQDKTFIQVGKPHKPVFKSLFTSGLDTVYKISGKDDKIANQIMLQVYLPDKLNSDNTRAMKLYTINFGHTKLSIPNTIITIDAAIQNSLYISGDQKERMLKSLHHVLSNPLIFNNLSNSQLSIITHAIELLELPETAEESELPRFISYDFYKEFTATINIYLLNTITDKPLALSKDGSHVPLYLTDILPLLKRGFELDLGADKFTELDDQIEIHREIELGLDVNDPLLEEHLRDDLKNILD
jgi:hypothetical protein